MYFSRKLFVFERKFLHSTVFCIPYMLLLKHINYERQVTLMYLDTFTLPIDFEEPMIQKQCERNGGIYGYIDNTYSVQNVRKS